MPKRTSKALSAHTDFEWEENSAGPLYFFFYLPSSDHIRKVVPFFSWMTFLLPNFDSRPEWAFMLTLPAAPPLTASL